MANLSASPALAAALSGGEGSTAPLPATLRQAGQHAAQTLDLILRRWNRAVPDDNRMAKPGDRGVAAARHWLLMCRDLVDRATAAGCALHQLAMPTPETQVLEQRGALAARRAGVTAELLTHCGDLSRAAAAMLAALLAPEQPGSKEGDPIRGPHPVLLPACRDLAPSILLAGACGLSLLLSLVETIPLSLPYVAWLTDCSRTMLLVLECEQPGAAQPVPDDAAPCWAGMAGQIDLIRAHCEAASIACTAAGHAAHTAGMPGADAHNSHGRAWTATIREE